MTAKRFIYDGLHIRDLHGKIPPILTNNDKIRDKYLNELNELHEENRSLKFQLDECQNHKLFQCSRRELEKENEQLKQQNENLLAKLKFTAEQLNYSENLRKMFDGDVE